jgi:hypothetical protein
LCRLGTALDSSRGGDPAVCRRDGCRPDRHGPTRGARLVQ